MKGRAYLLALQMNFINLLTEVTRRVFKIAPTFMSGVIKQKNYSALTKIARILWLKPILLWYLFFPDINVRAIESIFNFLYNFPYPWGTGKNKKISTEMWIFFYFL